MSLSPVVSFQSRFVTYLLTFTRTNRTILKTNENYNVCSDMFRFTQEP